MSHSRLQRLCVYLVLWCIVAPAWRLPAAAQTPDPALDAALAAALREHQNDSPFYYVEVGRVSDANGAVVYLVPHDVQTDQPIPGIVDWGVALREAGGWQVALPGNLAYTAMLERLSPGVKTAIDDRAYREQADPAIATKLTLDDYQFPWEEGRWATVTRSFDRHGIGKIDFDLSARAITAAKDGVIVYAADRYSRNSYGSGAWWYWNAVVIEHDPYEYSLYGHIEPGSIPVSIREQCDDDISRANCAVPVQAGDIIALEGNTGYSQNDHLHLETGQRFGVAAYADVHDGDGDGDRRDLAYGAYIYGEHNIAFAGYTADDVAMWPFGALRQALHQPPPGAGVELIRNGDFNDGTMEWVPSGQLNWQVRDGVLRAVRLRTTEPPQWAAFYQDLGVGMPANFPLDLRFELGSDSALAKTVTVTLYNAAGRHYGAVSCDFALPPNTLLQAYSMQAATTDTWARVRLEFAVNPPDGSPAVLVDNISAMHQPRAAGPTACAGPDAAA